MNETYFLKNLLDIFQIRMAEKADKDQKLQSHISGESVRVVSEAVGISGLPEPAANYLAEDCTYRLKMMVQVSYIITGELSQFTVDVRGLCQSQ